MNVLNTTDESFAKRNFPNGYESREIECLSLNNILEKTRFKNKIIDFLNVDVENTEKDVLESLNFDIYRPRLICVEIHSENEESFKNNPTFKFLDNKGYKIVWKKEYSYIFSFN